MYALEATSTLLETLLADSFPLWAINAIHEDLSDKYRLGSSATFSKYDLEKAYTVYDDLDALIYDMSLEVSELPEVYDECFEAVVSHIKEEGQFVAEYQGVLLISNGEQY